MFLKIVIRHTLVCIVLFGIFFGLHKTLLNGLSTSLPFQLVYIYLFNALMTLAICVGFEALFRFSKKYSEQLGFIYMGTMVFKIVVFCVVFNSILFSEIDLTRSESLSLLLPLFIFLGYEVYAISRILNRKPFDFN